MAQQQDNNKKTALKDYVEVNVRIEKFWEKYSEGRIDTEIIKWEDGVVVMKASAYKNKDDEKPSAVGHAYEKEGSSFINKTSALENCETSAVGRALAILGFEIKKSIASKEEVENAKLNQNKQEPLPDPITSEQLGELKVKVLEFANLREKTEQDVYTALKIKSLEELNQKTVPQVRAKLNKWISQATMEEKQ